MASKIEHVARRHPRAVLSQSVTFTVAGETHVAETTELGLGGAQVGTDLRFPDGSRLTFTLHHEQNETSAPARVVRSLSTGFAVEFTDLPDEFVAMLLDIVCPHLSYDAWERLETGRSLRESESTK